MISKELLRIFHPREQTPPQGFLTLYGFPCCEFHSTEKTYRCPKCKEGKIDSQHELWVCLTCPMYTDPELGLPLHDCLQIHSAEIWSRVKRKHIQIESYPW